MRINVSLPKSLKKDLDKFCKKNSLQKSELIRNLIRIEIYNEKVFQPFTQVVSKFKKDKSITTHTDGEDIIIYNEGGDING